MGESNADPGSAPCCANQGLARPMSGFVARKLLGMVATLLVAAVIIFVLLDLVPGDPARFILGINATDEAVAVLRGTLGLDQPAILRLFGWVGGMLVGEFGTSFTQNAPVGGLIAERLGVTLPLALLAMILSGAIGLPLGILAARHRGSFADTGLMALARAGIAVPNFWLGMLLVLLFSVTLRWLPPGGFVPWGDNALGALSSLVLPALALALPQAAILAREMRTALIDVQRSDYILAARAKGMTMRDAVRTHGMRNAFLAVLAILGLQFSTLIAGTVIVETVFYLPGLGRLIFDAIAARDLILIRSAIMVLILVMIGTIFLTDLYTIWVDRRLRERSVQ
jgi:peptide/nickel transport system permease protein